MTPSKMHVTARRGSDTFAHGEIDNVNVSMPGLAHVTMTLDNDGLHGVIEINAPHAASIRYVQKNADINDPARTLYSGAAYVEIVR